MSDPARVGEFKPLIDKYSPYLYLHPDEAYLTSSFEWFLQRPDVYLGPADQRHKVPSELPTGDASGNQFLSYDWNNATVRRGDLASTQIYVNAIQHDLFKTGRQHRALQYWIFYPFNGPATAELTLDLEFRHPSFPDVWNTDTEHKTIKSKISLEPFGEHQGDWEHFTLYFQDDQLKLIRASEHNYYTDFHPPADPNG